MGNLIKTWGLVALMVAVIAVAVVLVPWITIWSLNTISEQSGMGWHIPHNFWTYVAVLILAMIANSGGAKRG